MAHSVVCLVLLAVGLGIGYHQRNLLDGKEIVLGRVTELLPRRGSKGGTTYAIRASFEDNRGQRHVYTSSWAAGNPGYAVGDTVRLYFNPASPEESGMASFGIRFGAATIFLLLAGLIWFAPHFAKLCEAWMDRAYPVTVRTSYSQHP